jgi:hypothetical protein
MLWLLTGKLRTSVTFIVTVIYALCATAPAIALAFASDASAAHCLTDHHKPGNNHRHATPAHNDGVAHDHFAPGDNNDQSTQCCGVSCLYATAQNPTLIAIAAPQPDAPVAISTAGVFGQGPDRIDRPPRFLSSH